MFLTYDEFVEYGGTITDEIMYERLEYKARSMINHATFNRIANETTARESVKRCMFELINLLNEAESSSSGMIGVSSMSNDGVSVNFSAGRDAEISAKANKIINDYLSMEEIGGGITLTYRGVFT